MTEITEQDKLDLGHGRYLAEHGVPVFAAPPDEDSKLGFKLPLRWQRIEADPSRVDEWQPGWALCAVMGHVVDLLDVDPRSGGADSLAQMRKAGLVPRAYGRQSTPSGGTHDFIATMGVRGLDKVFPGVDVKAGIDGEGHGFAFLAPTRRVSKVTGELVGYQWIEAPVLDELSLVGGDGSGVGLAALVRARGASVAYVGPTYDGPAYGALSIREQRLADAYVEGVVSQWRQRLEEAAGWDEGEVDDKFRGWEMLSRDWSWACARVAACDWTAWTEEDAEATFWQVLPDEMAAVKECQKWYGGIVSKARGKPVEPPWWLEFVEVDPHADLPDVPARLEEAHLSEWMAWKGVGGDWVWSKSFGWMCWGGRKWEARSEEDAMEAVRRAVIEVNRAALDAGADREKMKKLAELLSTRKISYVTRLMRGVVSVSSGAFDQQPDMLNVGNGVVDLRTGELLPHDKHLLLTKMTNVDYRPGTVHPDWVQALECLEGPVVDWLQVRLGQAATGWPTSDDVLPVGQGGGSNGKSTLLAALFAAMGEHMTHVPEKLLRASPNDHPTELMTLFGARIAVVDETPEAGQLNVPRLKATLGSTRMSARGVFKDNVTWTPTHSLFVMTNYVPVVHEVDRGTWRRLALIRFVKTFETDDRFRARMTRGEGGRDEAVLAWVVAGALEWYRQDMVLPPAPERVVEDTRAWRLESDLVMGYVNDRLTFDPDKCVLSTQLLEDVNRWLRQRKQREWSDKLLASRFGGHEEVTKHGVRKFQTRLTDALVLNSDSGLDAVPERPWVWYGVTWST